MKRACLALLISLIGFTLAFAQQKDEVRAELDRARRLERLNRYEEALRIHKRLFSADPGNSQAVDGIERDLLQLKRYTELIDFLQELLKEHPTDRPLLEKLGNALYRSDQKEEAEVTWSRIIEGEPHDEGSYAGVARQYLHNGLIDKTVDTYLEGRKRLDQPSLFARELARLYSSQMEFEEATREYVRLLEANPKQYSYVENMIGQFKRADTIDDAVAAVLEEAVESHPDDSHFRRLLGNHYFRTAQPERAYEQYVKVEEAERSNGGTLFDFAEGAYREGFYSTALTAYRHILELYPTSPLGPKIMQGIGRSLAKVGRFEDAISAFRSLASLYPTSKEKESALFEIGEIQLLELGQVDSALSAFGDLVDGRKRGRHYFDAMFRIGECLVVKGDLDGAKQEYEEVRKQARELPEIGDEATFRIGEVDYFRGDFDGALSELERLAKADPKGAYVNDALSLIVFIEENRVMGDDALRAFATAALLERQKSHSEAIEAYQRIRTHYSYSFLGDDALLKIGALQSEQGQFEVAIETYQQLLSTYPSSDLSDEAQRRVGEAYEVGLHDLPKAIEAYEEILSKYPDSLLYDRVRKKVRQLQVKVGAAG